MDSQEIRRAKQFVVFAFSVVCVLAALLLCLFLFETGKPVSPQLTVENLSSAMNVTSYQVLMGDSCYRLQDCISLVPVCQFGSWIEEVPAEPPQLLLTFKLAEEYELAFYENGFAQAYDGYSSRKYQGNVWYQVPENVASELAAYIAENGTPQQMGIGPESWFVLTE